MPTQVSRLQREGCVSSRGLQGGCADWAVREARDHEGRSQDSGWMVEGKGVLAEGTACTQPEGRIQGVEAGSAVCLGHSNTRAGRLSPRSVAFLG